MSFAPASALPKLRSRPPSTEASSPRVAAARRNWRRPTRSKSSHRGKVADAYSLRQELHLAAPARHGTLSVARSTNARGPSVTGRDRDGLAQARIGAGAHGPGLLGADRETRLPRA